MLDRKMSHKYIKFFALFILALGAAGPVSANCHGYEWTYNWESPYDNRNAFGCDCSESSDGYRIYEKNHGTYNYWDGTKSQCKFPNYSRCNDISVWRDKWETCSGSWISSSSPSTSVTALTEGMTAKMTSNGWLWSCKEGYALKSDKSGCMINPVNPCGTDGTKVLYKGQCYDKPASGYGFDYTPGTVSDAVIECSTKKLANGLVYQKLFDGYVCITCTGNFYIRNTEMWFENGNCGEVKKINQYKFTECAKKGLVDKDLENCLLN